MFLTLEVVLSWASYMLDVQNSDSRGRWLYLMLPYQIAYGPVSSLIILYIYGLHGTVIGISIAVALSNLLGVVASLFWGEIIDMYNRRRIFMSISFAALTLSLLGFFFTKSVLNVILIYGMLSFMITANATPLNLLVMETNAKKRWAEGFSKLQMFSGIGSTLGFVFVFLLSGFLSVNYLMLLLVPFSVIALALTSLIKEPKKALGKHSILESIHSFRSRLLTLFVFFVRIPSWQRIKGLIRRFYTLNLPKMNTLNALYLATLIFYIGSAIFNTAYLVGLRYKGVSDFDVLLIVLIGSIVQTIAFYVSGVFTEKKGKTHVASSYLILRGFGYIAIAVAFALFGSTANFWVGLIFYSVAAGLAYAVVYTAFNTMIFEAIGTENKGKKLGVYSGFAGLGALLGALLAGLLSYFVGFWFSVAVSGILIFVTAYIIVRLPKLTRPISTVKGTRLEII